MENRYLSLKLWRLRLGLGALLTFSLVGISMVSQAQEVVLEIKTGAQVAQWSREKLLTEAVDITILKDSAYQRTMQYRAVPFAKLMPNVGQYGSVQFVALDGFVANITGHDLAGAGQPYLAVETLEQAWPAVKPDNPAKTASAGPFYLVWLTPAAGKITNEQWPYQVAKISVELPLQQRHPQIIPAAESLPKSRISYEQAMRGMQVYIKNCAVCHTMNGGGDAAIGPDLNLPFNPTEYLQEPFLRQLIRQPGAVRSWKQSLMPGFDEQTISKQELNDLVAYLKRMASQRKYR
ncbi:c-type cytochrome [Undibacterium flavidum]|uniref:Cytochrome c n=1 Tax=Undibacterium flavidum TaxID=2762297 RepID=A0ABR6Y9I4_9BURK|nr:cytochrome c [Undibacterium flavidum]MBC3873283.1 cytochrome c [Undibacterium flavidum]